MEHEQEPIRKPDWTVIWGSVAMITLCASPLIIGTLINAVS